MPLTVSATSRVRDYDRLRFSLGFTVSSCGLCLVIVLCCAAGTDAGLLPTLPTFPNPFDGARGWYFPNFLSFDLKKVSEFWSDIPRQATNFLTKLVPQPIKNLLNFDPVPDWVPNPRGFKDDAPNPEENETDMSFASSENQSLNNVTDYEEYDEVREKTDDIINNEEKGNLHGIGRDVIRSLTNQFSNNTTGLDTDESFFNGLLNGFKDKVKAIFPGTQWCGDGNVARTKKDLGFFYKTDSCCREHDSCSDFIEKDESKYGLLNRGLFTRSNCECDEKFYKCLKDSKDMISSQIGMAYFSVLGPQCFKKEYPIVDCRIRVGLTNRCIDYELDNSTEKNFQWFDNPEY